MSVNSCKWNFHIKIFDGVFLSTEIAMEQQAYFYFILLLDKYSSATLLKIRDTICYSELMGF